MYNQMILSKDTSSNDASIAPINELRLEIFNESWDDGFDQEMTHRTISSTDVFTVYLVAVSLNAISYGNAICIKNKGLNPFIIWFSPWFVVERCNFLCGSSDAVTSKHLYLFTVNIFARLHTLEHSPDGSSGEFLQSARIWENG